MSCRAPQDLWQSQSKRLQKGLWIWRKRCMCGEGWRVSRHGSWRRKFGGDECFRTLPEDEGDKKAVPENKLILENLAEGLLLFKTAFGSFYSRGPSMRWALKLKQTLGKGLVLYRNIFREMKKQKSQTEIAMYFCEVTLSVPACSASPFTSSTASASSVTPDTRPALPPFPPPHPTQKLSWWYTPT